MEDMNEYFENIRKSSERLEHRFQEINKEAQQHLEKINQKVEGLTKNAELESAVIASTNDHILTGGIEANLQSTMIALNSKKMKSKEDPKILQPLLYDEKENVEDYSFSESSKKIISELPSGAGLYIPEEVMKKSMKKSVKPEVKVKNKQKMKKMDQEKMNRKVLKFVGTVVLTAGITTSVVRNFADDVYANHLKKEALEEYTETIYEPNTKEEWARNDGVNRLMDSHDFENMIEETRQRYEDPVVGFYMLYTKLDQECKNNYMNSIMASFNLHYGTDYKDLEDILVKNNFKDYYELSKYVSFEIYKLHAEEEKVYDGSQSSTLGR